jgi:hypothetical protein
VALPYEPTGHSKQRLDPATGVKYPAEQPKHAATDVLFTSKL